MEDENIFSNGNKRKNSEKINNLEKIKKSKMENTTYAFTKMGKGPTNKDKMNIIELDINELS